VLLGTPCEWSFADSFATAVQQHLVDLARSTFACLTIRQARVSLDHFLSDVGLVIETIETFSPASDARTV